MTKIKLCGLSRPCDIEYANELAPDYVGFVFFKKSRRYITPEKATELKALLAPGITAVGVFVDEPVEEVARLLNDGVIDMAQLHGSEDENYIERLRTETCKKIIKAFRAKDGSFPPETESSVADLILLDSGMGSGTAFDRSAAEGISRPYFLAGGLYPENVAEAIAALHPFGVDVSSGVEADGFKDKEKMTAFVNAVRKEY